MQNAVRRSIPITLLAMLISVAFGSGLAHAQSGSAGGSIGNDEKSLSGSRAGESSKPARRSQPEGTNRAAPNARAAAAATISMAPGSSAASA
jgi:hypothetical protein